MGMYGASTEAKDMGSKSRDWKMMGVVTGCMMAENVIMPGMGLGVGFGYPTTGNGGFGSYGGQGVAPIAEPAGAVSK